ncbi:hypothetical protein GOBAR_DD34794 [Gossypium barbadense]|nr:hypothetical protein GOBAR_DD34794 [Gossypium barbadense]
MVEADNSGENDTGSVGAGEAAFRLWMVVEKKILPWSKRCKCEGSIENRERILWFKAISINRGSRKGIEEEVKDNMDGTLGAGSSVGSFSALGRETQMGPAKLFEASHAGDAVLGQGVSGK